MTRMRAELVLVAIVLAVSSAYLFTKLGTATMGQFNVVALRFGIAFAALAAFTWRRLLHANRRTVGAGALLAALMFAILALQAFGLDSVSTSEGAFLSSTTTGFVPIMVAVLTRKLPKPAVLGGCMLVLAGIFCITGAGAIELTQGAVMYLASAVVYGMFIIAVDRFSEEVDVLAAGVLEMGFAFVLSLVCSLAFEWPRLPVTVQEWAFVLALGLLCSAFGLGVQPWAQRFTTPERYGVLFGLAPLFSALLGVLVLGERLTPLSVVGAALILSGVLIVVRADSASARGASGPPPKARPSACARDR